MDWRRTADHPAARWARLGGLASIGVIMAVAMGFLLIPLAARGFVRGMVLLAAGCVWLATSLSMGVSVWTLLATMWRKGAATLATPGASVALWGLVAMGALALYWLQRLLGSEEE